MSFYKINREERHFGFLLQSVILSSKSFREKVFSRFANKTGLQLDPDNFDLYAEVALFRDYWFSFGDQAIYSPETRKRRISFINELFTAMKLNPSLIDQYGVFWTGPVGNSKIWFPGRWAKNQLHEIESAENIKDKSLFRMRWMCNAKPDVMISSKGSSLFIEIKLESGFGFNDDGYDQKQTQSDILNLSPIVLPFMKGQKVAHTSLTVAGGESEISWGEVVKDILALDSSGNAGLEMIKRHFDFIIKTDNGRTAALAS